MKNSITLIILLVSPFTYANLDDGLVGHWELNGNASDSSGYNHDGQIEGAVLTTDRFGNSGSAFYFDGVDDRIVIGDYELATGNQISVQAWFKTNSTLTYAHPLVSKLCGGISYYLGANLYDGDKIQFIVNYTWGNHTASNTALNDGTWHHAVGVYDGALMSGNIKLYIDGVLQGMTSNLQSNINNVSESISIGGNHPSGGPNPDFYNGYIDDVRIYDRALSAGEVGQLYTIPEPCTLLLLGLGSFILRRKK